MPQRATLFDALSWLLPGIGLWAAACCLALAGAPGLVPWLAPTTGVLSLVHWLVWWGLGAAVIQALSTWAYATVLHQGGPEAAVHALRHPGVLSQPELAEVLHRLTTAALIDEAERQALPTDIDVTRLVYQRAWDATLRGPRARHALGAQAQVQLYRGLALAAGLLTVGGALGWVWWLLRAVLWLLLTVVTLGYGTGPFPGAWHDLGLALGLTVITPGLFALLYWRADRAEEDEARQVLLGAAGSAPRP